MKKVPETPEKVKKRVRQYNPLPIRKIPTKLFLNSFEVRSYIYAHLRTNYIGSSDNMFRTTLMLYSLV